MRRSPHHLLALSCLLLLLARESTASRSVHATRPMMGLSTWNQFALSINSSLVLQVAEAMVSRGALAAGYTMLALDDGWGAQNRNASGCIVADPAKFPQGMLNLSQAIHAMGLQLGLYTARSNLTCSKQMPGSLGHEQVDAKTFAYYGADYVKNDDCDTIYARAAEDYAAMEQALQAQSRPMLHDVKAPDLTPAQAVAVSQFRRVGKDLKNDWWDMVRVLDTGDDNSYLDMVGPARGFFADFDMLEVGNDVPGTGGSMTMREWQAHFSLWAAFKSPLQIGCDIRNVNDSVMDIMLNGEVININHDSLGVPVRRLQSTAPAADDTVTKVYLSSCVSAAEDPAMARRQQWSVRTANNGTLQIVQADGRCLEVFACQALWPFMMSVSPCASAGDELPRGSATCTTAMSQQWTNRKLNDTYFRLASALTGCWPASGGASNDPACCASAEGSNVEIDRCEWSLTPLRDVWTTEAGDGTLRSAMDGRCLTLAGNLEVYGGPLSGNRATAVLFNRSPLDANITVDFAGLNLPTTSPVQVRDVLAKTNTTAVGKFTALVPTHGVAHVVLTP